MAAKSPSIPARRARRCTISPTAAAERAGPIRFFQSRRKIAASVIPDASSQSLSASAARTSTGLSGVEEAVTPACWVTHVSGSDFAPATPAAGEPEAEQGTVTQAPQAVIAGGYYRLEFRQGDRALLARALPSFDRGAGSSGQHGADRRLLAGIRCLFEPMGGGQCGDALTHVVRAVDQRGGSHGTGHH